MQVVTLIAARAACWKQLSSQVYDESNAAEIAQANARINLALERFFSSGTWRGTLERVAITSYACLDPSGNTIQAVTLPRGLQTILGVKSSYSRLLVRPIWYEFIGGSCSLHGTTGLNDLGEGFCTFRDIPEALPLVIRTGEDADSTAVMTIVIRGPDGVSQFEVELKNAATEITDPLATSIIRINKPVTDGKIEIYYKQDGVETLISTLKPSETDANYRRYRVATSTETVDAICKRAYVPAAADLEPLVPNNLGALKLMLMALQFEDKSDMERALQYRAEAISLADADRQQFDGDNQTPIFNVTRGMGAADIAQLDGVGIGYGGYSHYG